MKLLRVKQLPLSILFAALFQLSTPAANAANTVDLSSATHWVCDGDFTVKLDAKSGVLRTIVKSRKIDESLPFYTCNSSHCDWGNGPGAELCQEVPCAEIVAEEKYQHLWIRLKDFEGRCDAVKSKDTQN